MTFEWPCAPAFWITGFIMVVHIVLNSIGIAYCNKLLKENKDACKDCKVYSTRDFLVNTLVVPSLLLAVMTYYLMSSKTTLCFTNFGFSGLMIIITIMTTFLTTTSMSMRVVQQYAKIFRGSGDFGLSGALILLVMIESILLVLALYFVGKQPDVLAAAKSMANVPKTFVQGFDSFKKRGKVDEVRGAEPTRASVVNESKGVGDTKSGTSEDFKNISV